MPIFEFKCKKCNHKFEELVYSSSADFEQIACPECGERAAEKLMSTFCSGSKSSSSMSTAPACGRSGFS